jgi:hypothetical protein
MKLIDLTNVPKEPINNHTSKGNQPKWLIKNKWYKADHMGYEGLSEYIVSNLLKKSNISDFVDYELIKIKYDGKESMGCVSDNFRQSNEMLIPIEKLHRQYYGFGLADALAKIVSVKEKIKYTVRFIEETTNIENVGEYITVMLTVDAFFLNEDRHTNNIAVIRNEDTKKFRLAPIFDNGLSLLSDLNDYCIGDDLYDNIKKVKAKPFDNNFDEQLDIAEELYGSLVKFEFTRSDIYSIIDRLRGIYDEKIIKRAEKVLLEQMRKYAVYF